MNVCMYRYIHVYICMYNCICVYIYTYIHCIHAHSGIAIRAFSAHFVRSIPSPVVARGRHCSFTSSTRSFHLGVSDRRSLKLGLKRIL